MPISVYVENEINIPSVVARQVAVALAIQPGNLSVLPGTLIKAGGGNQHQKVVL